MCKFASETYKQLIMDAQKTKEQALEFIKNAVKHKQEWKKELETFTIRTTHATLEGQELYVAIIVENRNRHLKDVTDEFDNTVIALADKP